MQKIDSRMIAVVTLIVGLLVGYYVDSAILNKPRIDSLTQTISVQDTTINNLETQLQSLQNNYDSLQTEYDQLESETQEQSEDMENTISQLQNQV